MAKDVTELAVSALIVLFPTFTARTALGCICFKKPRSISFSTIRSLMTLKAPVVEAEHPPMSIISISTKQAADGHAYNPLKQSLM